MGTIASIGGGWVAREVWLPRFLAQEYRCVGVMEPDSVSASSIQQKLGPISILASLEEVVNTSPDVVLIASPNCYHADTASYFLSHHIAVIVEKPVCLSPLEFQKIKSAVEFSKAPLFTSQAILYRSDIHLLRSICQSDLGDIYSMELCWVRANGIPRPGSWFTHRFLAGGGVLWDLGWHMFELALSLLSYPRITRFQASLYNYFLKAGSISPKINWRNEADPTYSYSMDVEDNAMGAFFTEENVCVRFHFGWASHQNLDECIIKIRGSQGEATLHTTFGFSPNRIKSRIVLFQKGIEKEYTYPDEPIGKEYEKLVNDIIARRKSDSSDSSAKTLKEIESIVNLIHGLYQSAESTEKCLV